MENQSKPITIEWSRWITVGGTDPRDIPPSEYSGPVLFQFEGGIDTHSGTLRDGQFLVDDVAYYDVARWKPAPVRDYR